jgi:Fic family protein
VGDALIKAGLAHLWLVTLHPFDDGNGRISRAVGVKCVAF